MVLIGTHFEILTLTGIQPTMVTYIIWTDNPRVGGPVLVIEMPHIWQRSHNYVIIYYVLVLSSDMCKDDQKANAGLHTTTYEEFASNYSIQGVHGWSPACAETTFCHPGWLT